MRLVLAVLLLFSSFWTLIPAQVGRQAAVAEFRQKEESELPFSLDTINAPDDGGQAAFADVGDAEVRLQVTDETGASEQTAGLPVEAVPEEAAGLRAAKASEQTPGLQAAGTSEETAGLLSGEMAGLQEAAESKQEQVHTVQDSAGTAGQNWTCEEDLLARIIACEMGCNWIPDEQQLYVGSVVLNRVASDLFPDTLQEVIYQPGQYAPAISGWLETVQPDERTRENARWLLENGSVLPENVLYQSTVVQGEVYASYYDETLGTTTYYCFGG